MLKDNSDDIEALPKTKLEGLTQVWFQNGQLRFKGNYRNGMLEGLTNVWFQNGQLNSEQIYKNGIKAFSRVWWESGIQCREISYIGFGDNVSEWDENGELLYKGSFRNWKNIY